MSNHGQILKCRLVRDICTLKKTNKKGNSEMPQIYPRFVFKMIQPPQKMGVLLMTHALQTKNLVRFSGSESCHYPANSETPCLLVTAGTFPELLPQALFNDGLWQLLFFGLEPGAPCLFHILDDFQSQIVDVMYSKGSMYGIFTYNLPKKSSNCREICQSPISSGYVCAFFGHCSVPHS